MAYFLAIALALGSFSLYMAAFFFPEVYRKYDLLWSGVGMFYALVLWVCAGRMTGAVLLGQIASVALIGWLGWQTLTLRRSLTPVEQQTSVSPGVRSWWSRLQERVQGMQQRFQRRTKSSTVPSVRSSTGASAAPPGQDSGAAVPQPAVKARSKRAVVSPRSTNQRSGDSAPPVPPAADNHS